MATATVKRAGRAPKSEWFVRRNSPIHGYGCFARKDIPKGTRIAEYVGERLSHKEADARYEDADPNDNHTFLFIADRKTVIDATRGGNDSRFINHSCDGNCTSETEKGRVFIDTIKDIPKGTELSYDYQIPRDKEDPDDVDVTYACRCGSPKCRGSMLWPPLKEFLKKKRAKAKLAREKARAKKAKQAKTAKTAKTVTRSKAGSNRSKTGVGAKRRKGSGRRAA